MPAILAIFSKKKLDPPLFSILQMLEWNKRASFYAIVLILLWKKLHFKLAITLQPIFIRFRSKFGVSPRQWQQTMSEK